MSTPVRITTVAALVVLLVWLGSEPSSTERRWAKIELEIKRGNIAALPEKAQKTFEDNIRWIAPYAGIVSPFVINGPRQRGKLHFYTTKPAAISATGCASGNAIYDAALDVVFIDEHIVHPAELPLLGEQGRTSLIDVEDLAFVPVYLRFILSHELGHRQLHRASGGFFDKSVGSRDLEREADDFAVKTLVSAYSGDVVTGKRDLGESAAEFIAMDKDPTTAVERVWVDLVGSVYAISFAQMFSASEFSSFYSDTAHPNFVQRASRVFDLAIESPETASTLKSHSRIFREALARLQEFSEATYTEIQCPEGVLQVALADGRLSIMTSTGKIFTVPLTSLDDRRTVDLRSVAIMEPPTVAPDQAWLSDMWGTNHQGLMVIGNPQQPGSAVNVQALRGSRVAILQNLSAKLVGKWPGKLIAPTQPADFAVLEGSKQLTVLAGNSAFEISWTELRRTLFAKAGVSTAHAEMIVPTFEALHVAVYEGPQKRQLIGIAKLGLDGSLKRFLRVQFSDAEGGGAIGLPGDQVVAVPSKTGDFYLYCTRNRTHFLLFQMSEAKPMELLCSHPLIFDKALSIGGGTGYGIAAFDARMQAARWIATNHVLIQFSKDSVLSVDLATRSCTHLFPGIIEVEMCAGSEGDVVFFAKNGLKLYLVKTKP